MTQKSNRCHRPRTTAVVTSSPGLSDCLSGVIHGDPLGRLAIAASDIGWLITIQRTASIHLNLRCIPTRWGSTECRWPLAMGGGLRVKRWTVLGVLSPAHNLLNRGKGPTYKHHPPLRRGVITNMLGPFYSMIGCSFCLFEPRNLSFGFWTNQPTTSNNHFRFNVSSWKWWCQLTGLLSNKTLVKMEMESGLRTKMNIPWLTGSSRPL